MPPSWEGAWGASGSADAGRGPCPPRQSCGPSSLLAPSRGWPSSPLSCTACCSPARLRGNVSALRPAPGSHLRPAMEASRTPVPSGSRGPPHSWEGSSWLNLVNRALALHMRAGSLGHHRPVWKSLRGRAWGPSTQASLATFWVLSPQEGSKTCLPEGTARPPWVLTRVGAPGAALRALERAAGLMARSSGLTVQTTGQPSHHT